jgi:transcriptional regulator with XRE-family HTH domain
MTQDQLAQVLGWHRSRLARIECGERRVYVPEFIDIAIALKVDPTELFARVLLW